MDGKTASVFLICTLKQLLEELGVQYGNKEVETCIIIGYEREYSAFLLA